MTIEIKHKFQSAKADSGDGSLVRPSNWNDSHNITLAAQRLLGRAAGSAGNAQEIVLGTGLVFDATAVSLKADPATIVTEASITAALGGSVGWSAATVHALTAVTTLKELDELAIFREEVTSGEEGRKITADNFWQQMKWRTWPLGVVYMVDQTLTGAEIPPSSTTETVWIMLSAGQTGAGLFNNGKLISESVSGSAPLVQATAVVSFTGSPMNGAVVDLLNTEGRILRPGASSGVKQNDAFQGHRHLGGNPMSIGGSNGEVEAGGNYERNTYSESDGTDSGSNGTPRVSNETRMKNVSVRAFMRIK